MKKIEVIVLVSLFLIVLTVGNVSSLQFDNVVKYENNNLKAKFVNAFGLGETIGVAELKSHKSVDEVRGVSWGELMPDYVQPSLVVMFYDFDMPEEKINGLESFEITSIKNGEKVTRDKRFVIWVEEIQEIPLSSCNEDLAIRDGVATGCVQTGVKNKTVGHWEVYNSTNIPSGKSRIGIEVASEQGDLMDGVLGVLGEKLDKHSEWDATLTAITDEAFQFNEGTGTTTTGSIAGITLTRTGVEKWASADLVDGVGSATNTTKGGWANSSDASLLGGSPPRSISFIVNATNHQHVKVMLRKDVGGYGQYYFQKDNDYADTFYFIAFDSGGTPVLIGANGTMNDGGRHLVTAVIDGTNNWVWIDDRLAGKVAMSDFASGGEGAFTIGSGNLDTEMDEVNLYNAALTPAQVAQLYNGGNFIKYAPASDELSVSLVSPANNTNFTSSPTLVTNLSTSSVALGATSHTVKVWFATNGSLMFTDTNTSGLFANYSWTPGSLPDGLYNWSAYAVGNDSIQYNVTAPRFFSIDSTPPTITIQNQTDGSTITVSTSPTTLWGNVTISDATSSLDTCRAYNGTINSTFNCANGNFSFVTTEGAHTWTIYANDSRGNSHTNQTSFFVNWVRTDHTYDSFVVENQNISIYFNLTATNLSTSSANMTYNETIYPMTEVVANNGTYASYRTFLTVPEIASDQNATIFFNYSVNGGLLSTTPALQQHLYNIPSLVFATSPCGDVAFNFTLRDEGNLTQINGTFQYNFAYGLPNANNTYSRIFGEISNAHTIYTCINSTISPSWELGEGQIFYTSDNYVDRRYYLFSPTTLTNQTTNITLYDLWSSQQTSFKLEVEDSSLNPYSDFFATLIRWYPDLNEYNVVDMGLTDETGSTVIHVRTEDVDYRIGVYHQNGTLVKLADPIRMVCLVSPCTYTLKITPRDSDYTSFLGIDYTLDYNQTTGIWTYTFADSSQRTTQMNLTVYKLTGTAVYPVCTSSVSAYTVAITCNTSSYTGTLKAVVERSASPPVKIAEKIVSVVTSAFSSSYGLWIALLIAIPIIFIFAFMTPLGAVIGGVVALIPALYFGTVSWVVVGGVANIYQFECAILVSD